MALTILEAQLLGALRALLTTYELTGDHQHGAQPLAPGAPCPGGDCNVTRARDAIGRAERLRTEPPTTTSINRPPLAG